jgi:FixJ family two-component response regulator
MCKLIVYVVDDSRLVLSAVEALLTVSGYAARCFLSPYGFLASRSRPNDGCLVIDFTAPVIDPAAFMGRLRSEGRHLPVIMATFMFDRAKTQTWLKHGVFAVVEKPFDATDFLGTVEQALNLSPFGAACSSLSSLAGCGSPAGESPSYPR